MMYLGQNDFKFSNNEKRMSKDQGKSMAPVHCVIIHEGPVALQVELAECEHTQSYK